MTRLSEPGLENADGVAALALVRAFIAYVHDVHGMTVEEVSAIQTAAIEDLAEMTGEIYDEARQVITHAFP